MKKHLKTSENTLEELSFDEVYDRYSLLCKSLANHFSKYYDFDDLFQEATIALYRAYNDYNNTGVTFGYYAKKIIWFILNRYHRNRLQKLGFKTSKINYFTSLNEDRTMIHTLVDEKSDFEEYICDKDLIERLVIKINDFKVRDKDIYIRYLKGHKYKDIARIHNTTKQNVSMIVSRRSRELRKYYQNILDEVAK